MENFGIPSDCPLFSGLSEEEILHVLSCLRAVKRSYKKGTVVLRAGTENPKPGIVLSGRICLEKTDFSGNRTLMTTLSAPSLFGEALIHTKDKTLPADVVAATDAEILFLDAEKLASPCKNCCKEHVRILQNTVVILSEKNKFLTQRLGHITRRTLRGKILAFLSEERTKQHGNEIVIPFSREELAAYLAADRSALSAELSKMQKEGFFTFRKNKFLLHPEKNGFSE